MEEKEIAQALHRLGDLLEEQRIDKEEEIMKMLAPRLYLLLHKIDMHCRSLCKHGDISDAEYEQLDLVRQMLYEDSAYTLLNEL